MIRDHLNPAMLEGFLEAEPVVPGVRLELPDGYQEHLNECEECRKLVEMFENSVQDLKSMCMETPIDKSPGCPPEETLRELACGLLREAQAGALLDHIVACDQCGPVYRKVTEELNADLSKEEEEFIANLKTSDPSLQANLARTMARKQVDQPRRWPTPGKIRLRFALPIGLAASLLVCAIVLSIRRTPDSDPNTLLAKAYTEQRSFDLRLPDAAYGPIRVERGTRSALSKPESLLEAEFKIKRGLSEKPGDPDLLDAEGRADLLEGQYDAAMKSLNTALNQHPNSPTVLTDLATAYTQRGDKENRPIDYGKAIDLLGQALHLDPSNQIAVFNRAIVDERLKLFEDAQKDWIEYLRLDGKSAWAQEARSHLDNLQKKPKDGSSQAPAESDPVLASIDLHNRLNSSGAGASFSDSRDEDYLDFAVRDWLPGLAKYPLNRSSFEHSKEWNALRALATVLSTDHRDRWLDDVLAVSPSPRLSHGLVELGLAASYNSKGDFDVAAKSALAAELALEPVSRAAFVRALWEHAYSMQRAQKGSACLTDTRRASQATDQQRYPWVSAQLLLEQAVCSGMLADMDRAKGQIDQAIRLVEKAHYSTLLLRSYHLRGIGAATEDPAEAWSWFMKGLDRHWSGRYQPFRAYQFYAEMALIAESRRQWYLAHSLMMESVVHISRTPNQLMAAIANQTLGTDAQMSGLQDEALEDFRRAQQIFSSIAETPAVNDLKASVQVEEASILCQEGQSAVALHLLESARPFLSGQTQYWTWFHYYNALADARLKLGRAAEAKTALDAAVGISERALGSIHSENDRVQWERQTQQTYRSLVQFEFDQENDPARALDLWEWYLAAPIRVRAGPATERRIDFANYMVQPLSIPKVSEQIRGSELHGVEFLSFAILKDEVIAWSYDGRSIFAARLPVSPAELERTASRFNQLCSDRSSDMAEIQRSGRQLYQWLIEPLRSHLNPSEELAIEADGILGAVPFGALYTPRNTYLDEEFTIFISPGMEYWNRLRQGSLFLRSDKTLAMGVTSGEASPGESLPSIPDSGLEAEEVSDYFEHPQILLGNNATFEAARRGFSSVRVFHFAGHSIVSETESGLVFANPESSGNATHWIGANRLDDLPLRSVDLVVLSACTTASRDPDGASPRPLIEPFFRGGVPNVIASRWDVDSSFTRVFMRKFYGFLVQKVSPAAALKRASAQARQDPETAHPYYWASFSAFGRN